VADTSEVSLLEATRAHLRANMSGTWRDDEIEIEIDEMAPAIAGDRYIMVMPSGVTTGPSHNPGGGTREFIYSVSVSVVLRASATPRDFTRSLMIDNLRSVNKLLWEADELIDFSETLRQAANVLINAAEGSTVENFIEPLRFGSIDPRPRIVSSAVFDASDEYRAGLQRSITYVGAKRITTR